MFAARSKRTDFTMYICQICKKAPATIHLTDIHNNVKKEVHMCEQCAAEKGFNMHTAANLPHLLGLAAKNKAGVMKSLHNDSEEDLICPVCGFKWSDFKAKGRLGCANDYQAFDKKMHALVANQLAPYDAQSETFHIGKTPISAGKSAIANPAKAALRNLERKLRQAVAAERYEEAAALKTEIDALKKETAESPIRQNS